MKRRRISSFIYWLTPVLIDVIFLYLFVKFISIYLNSEDIFSAIISICTFLFWLVFRFTFRFKTVFVDENFLYIFRYYGLRKIELKDVKFVNEKEMFPFKTTNTYRVEYLDDSLDIKAFKFYGSFLNREHLANFIEIIRNQ